MKTETVYFKNPKCTRHAYQNLLINHCYLKGTAVLLTVGSNTAEILLQPGHIKSCIQGFGVGFVVAEGSGGEVGVRGMEADRAGGDAAGNLQWNRKSRAWKNSENKHEQCHHT